MAASTIAASGSTRPGAMSRSAASRSRASHSARTAASGARLAHAVHARGAPPRLGPRRGRRRRAHRLELLPGPLQLALLGEQPGEHVAQRDEHLDVERRVDQASPREGDGATSRPPRAPSPTPARGAARPSGRARPAAGRATARPARCRTAAPGQARPRRDTADPGWRRAAPTRARSGRARVPTGRCAAGWGRRAPCPHPRGAAAPGRPVGSSEIPMPVPRRRRSVRAPRRAPRRCAQALGGRRRPGGARRLVGAVVGSGSPGGPLSDACVSVSG